MDLSLDLAGEAIDHAKKLDDPGVWMEALFLMGVTLYYRGDFAGARQHYETALARYDDDRERTLMWAVRVGEHAGVTHRCYLALALWHLGFADDAALVTAVVALVSAHITPTHRAAAARALDKELPKTT